MKLNKEKFLKTEFGSELLTTIKALDFYLCEKRKLSINEETITLDNNIRVLFAEWRIYQLALKQFYCIDYHFSRTDSYYGICTDNEDWLFKEERDYEA